MSYSPYTNLSVDNRRTDRVKPKYPLNFVFRGPKGGIKMWEISRKKILIPPSTNIGYLDTKPFLEQMMSKH